MVKQLDKLRTTNYNLILNEVGAGTPLYNTLVSVPGFSMKILNVESNNDIDFTRKHNSITDNIRLVSEETAIILAKETEKRTLSEYKKIELPIYTIVNTVQIATNENCVSHGWFAFKTDKTIHTYHYTLPTSFSRIEQIDEIGKIGVDILCYELFENYKLKSEFIDNTNLGIEQLLKFNYNKQSVHDNAFVCTNDGIKRFNNIFRNNNKPIFIYKGSFNPLSPVHFNIFKFLKKKYDFDFYFSISLNHRMNKPIILKNIVSRIELLNKFGINVIINRKSMFNDMYMLCKNTHNYDEHQIHFVMGYDTYDVFTKDVILQLRHNYALTSISGIENYINEEYKNVTFHVFDRDYKATNEIYKQTKTVFEEEFVNTNISSTEIRKLINNNNKEQLVRIYQSINDNTNIEQLVDYLLTEYNI